VTPTHSRPSPGEELHLDAEVSDASLSIPALAVALRLIGVLALLCWVAAWELTPYALT
jgi:hypothetical protein